MERNDRFPYSRLFRFAKSNWWSAGIVHFGWGPLAPRGIVHSRDILVVPVARDGAFGRRSQRVSSLGRLRSLVMRSARGELNTEPTPDPAAAGIPRRVSPAALTLVALFAAWYLVIAWSTLSHGLRGDFTSSYMGASLVRDGRLAELYDYQTQAGWWRAHAGRERVLVPYVRPPFYALVASPFAALPLPTLFAIDVAALTALLLGCWYWFARQLGEEALVFASLFLPTVLGIVSGQDCVLMLVLGVVSYHLHRKGRDRWAGVALALALYKYHLLLLLAPAMLLGRRWRMFAGFAIAAAGLSLLSLALVGPSGISAYIRLVFRKDLEGLYPSLQLMPNLNGLLTNFKLSSTPALVALIIFTLSLVAIAAWRAPWWRGMAASLAGSILIVPHVFDYDLTFLLLGLLLAIKSSQSKLTRATAAWLCFPLCHMANMFDAPWSAATSLSLLVFLSALARESVRNLAIVPPLRSPTVYSVSRDF